MNPSTKNEIKALFMKRKAKSERRPAKSRIIPT